eukprot:m.39150 g.39150  ORF g.39150 m.39150 type:complete len:57 (+) comp7919_c0_seq1:957-1127(+)
MWQVGVVNCEELTVLVEDAMNEISPGKSLCRKIVSFSSCPARSELSQFRGRSKSTI